MVASRLTMIRFPLVLAVALILASCASGPEQISTTEHDPVPGEATPAPQAGPRGGWAW
jgi:starvation-inducible outer membrane lipoprotein